MSNGRFVVVSLQCRRILASEDASERILIERAPSWIQTRKRLGEREKYVPGSGSSAERRSNGGGGREGDSQTKNGFACQDFQTSL